MMTSPAGGYTFHSCLGCRQNSARHVLVFRIQYGSPREEPAWFCSARFVFEYLPSRFGIMPQPRPRARRRRPRTWPCSRPACTLQIFPTSQWSGGRSWSPWTWSRSWCWPWSWTCPWSPWTCSWGPWTCSWGPWTCSREPWTCSWSPWTCSWGPWTCTWSPWKT